MSGIYIHIPFCKQACYYCDFHFSTTLNRKEEFVLALCKELMLRKKELTQPIETIYLGGGTPSLLTIDELRSLIEEVYENYNVISNPEITLEANPDDLSSEALAKGDLTLKTIKLIGVNRLSIGIQSFFDEDLQFMNRAHNAREAYESIELAKKYFENINVDLIYGIPGMSQERWQKNLDRVLSLNIPHISSYALTVEPKTALKKFIEIGKVAPVNDAVSKLHYEQMVTSFEHAGYINYEFSNFGKEGYFSKNNTAYWQGKSYLGIGPSAHSFHGTMRSWNIRNNIKYIKSISQGILPLEKETLNKTDMYNEYIMTGLRTIWGVSLKKVETDFGIKYLDYLLQQIKEPVEEGLLKIVTSNDSALRNNIEKLLITKRGKFLSDGIASNLFMVD